MDVEAKTVGSLIARHLLTKGAGAIAMHGYMASSDTEYFVSAGMFFAGIAWSWWQKSGQAEALAALARVKGTAAKASMVVMFAAVTFAASLGVVAEVRAADMPLKAPALNTDYPFNASGFYFGIGSLASSTSPTVNGQVQGSLQALGGSIGGVVGYRLGGKNVSFAVEAAAFYDTGNASACQLASCVVAARFSELDRVKMITPTQNIQNWFPQLGLPDMPGVPKLTGVTVSGQNTYIFAGGLIEDVSASIGTAVGRSWQGSPGFGVGQEIALSNGSALDVWAGYFNPTNGFHVGLPASYASQGRKLMVGLNWLF